MKLDLHIHTEASFDCDSDVRQVIETAEKAGLGAIAITDHDTMSAVETARKYARSVTVIPAMEITSEGGGHILGLFLKEEIKSRNIFDIIDEIHGQDGLVALAHPFRPGTGLLFNRDHLNQFSADEMRRIISGLDLIESINYRSCSDELVKTDRYFSSMPDISQIAGSDAHRLEEIGKATIAFEDFESNDLDEIKNALLTQEPIFRFEAYSSDYEIKTTTIKSGNRTLILKTKEKVQGIFINPINRLYQNVKSRFTDDTKEHVDSRQE